VTPADGKEMQSGSNQNHRDVHSEKYGYLLGTNVQLNKLSMKNVFKELMYF